MMRGCTFSLFPLYRGPEMRLLGPWFLISSLSRVIKPFRSVSINVSFTRVSQFYFIIVGVHLCPIHNAMTGHSVGLCLD